MISAHWSFIRDTDVPKPGAGEVVMTKAWVERGLSLPCSEFFLSILNTYGLQPHNICPNSYLLLSNFATLCEGHLGIRPDLDTLAEENFRTILRVPVSGDAAEEVRKTKRRKRSGHPTRRPLDLRSVPAPKLPALKPEPRRGLRQEAQDHQATSAELEESGCVSKMLATQQRSAPSSPAPSSDYRHPDHQPRTHYQIYEKVSGLALRLQLRQALPTLLHRRLPSVINLPSCHKYSTEIIPAYATKFFNKLTEAEKWELEQDLLNAMLNNAWGKPDAATSEIQDFKKDVGQFFDKLICKQKEQQALHYELHKNIALQRRVTLGQAENIRTLENENAELSKQLAEAQGWFPPFYAINSHSDFELIFDSYLYRRILFPGYDLLRA
ncbi:hypothetical protein QYE76_059377 [Lolium multiflorum]|uniref:Transposase (putative) gypsy type domain-containing protein n=1 Tax=Lolium multiflorum TaxID=4521 RepID=A0AAD8RX29_LOLMU|nr:hypothetical protein QYE76_059377 [Lolium multiflorum]